MESNELIKRISKDGIINLEDLSEADKELCKNITKDITLSNKDSIIKYGDSLIKTSEVNANKLLEISSIERTGDMAEHTVQLIAKLGQADISDPAKTNPLKRFLAKNIPGFEKILFNITKAATQVKKASTIVDEIKTRTQRNRLDLQEFFNTLSIMYQNEKKLVEDYSTLIVAGKYKYELLKSEYEKDLEENIRPDDELRIEKQNLDRFYDQIIDLIVDRESTLTVNIPEILTLQELVSKEFDTAGKIITRLIPSWERSMAISIIAGRARRVTEDDRLVQEAYNKSYVSLANQISDTSEQVSKNSRNTTIDVDSIIEARKTLVTSITRLLESDEKSREATLNKMKKLAENEIQFREQMKELLSKSNHVSNKLEFLD